MKWTIAYAALAACLIAPPVFAAQAESSASGGGSQASSPTITGANPQSKWNHVEVGVYADYLRFDISGSTSNFLGLGARVGANLTPHTALEAEANYDFARDFTQSVTTSNGVSTTTTITKSNIRPITALFGPKFQIGTSGPVRAFVTGKVGFVDFSTTTSAGAVSTIGGSATHFAAYPGGGIEFFGGPVGLRIDAGDELFLNNGVYNNFRATVGPTFRF